ncbi:MAG TPA: Uma2 family endonuclease [Chloroflexota bacterium]|nr:Uma2 family endonuclease [Chloroflexota bacterium]
MSTAHADWISPEAYLAAERRGDTKHEYLDGDVWAMAGATDRHVTITTNLVAVLRPLLRGSPCRLYSTDMQVYPTAEAYFYPDSMVCCDDRDRANHLAKYYPRLIVEVISPGTERVDRGKKARAYRRNETLAEYVFIATDRPWVEIYRRQSGFWVIHESGPAAAVALTSIDAAIDFATIYEDVDWSLPDVEETEA